MKEHSSTDQLSAANRFRLTQFLASVKDSSETFLGYPVSTDFNYHEIADFLQYPLNNLGDPFQESTWKVDSRKYEQEVVTFLARLFRAESGTFWGYVTNGGSEGNLYGLYLAREMYPEGVVYFSRDTHYSVIKNVHLLGMQYEIIASDPKGEIDYRALEESIRANRQKPAILFANIGTTMTEAKDDIVRMRSILDRLGITCRYIHSDAALCGGLAPFISPRIHFDFADGADSIAVSGHKSFGSPIPCGVVLAKKNHVRRIARSIEYIGTLDTTITGSRNGLTPLFLWYAIKKMGIRGFRRRVKNSLELAEYTETALQRAGVDAWRNRNAVTVVFPRVSRKIQKKYQLAAAGDITHLVLMPGTKKTRVDAFIDEISKSDCSS